jgi:hypothetical protein
MVTAGHSKAEIASAIKAAFDDKQLADLETSHEAPAWQPEWSAQRIVGNPEVVIDSPTASEWP